MCTEAEDDYYAELARDIDRAIVNRSADALALMSAAAHGAARATGLPQYTLLAGRAHSHAIAIKTGARRMH